MRILLRWVAGAVALYATVYLAQYFSIKLGIKGFVSALIVVAVLALVNAVIRPIVSLLTLPLNCLTVGLFGFVVNAAMFGLVGWLLPDYLRVGDFWAALFGSVVMSIISGLLNSFIPEENEK